jgi:hypothetical protein
MQQQQQQQTVRCAAQKRSEVKTSITSQRAIYGLHIQDAMDMSG